MKKKVNAKLQINRETLRSLSDHDLKRAAEKVVGAETGRSDCFCITETCSDGSCASWRCC